MWKVLKTLKKGINPKPAIYNYGGLEFVWFQGLDIDFENKLQKEGYELKKVFNGFFEVIQYLQNGYWFLLSDIAGFKVRKYKLFSLAQAYEKQIEKTIDIEVKKILSVFDRIFFKSQKTYLVTEKWLIFVFYLRHILDMIDKNYVALIDIAKKVKPAEDLRQPKVIAFLIRSRLKKKVRFYRFIYRWQKIYISRFDVGLAIEEARKLNILNGGTYVEGDFIE